MHLLAVQRLQVKNGYYTKIYATSNTKEAKFTTASDFDTQIAKIATVANIKKVEWVYSKQSGTNVDVAIPLTTTTTVNTTKTYTGTYGKTVSYESRPGDSSSWDDVVRYYSWTCPGCGQTFGRTGEERWGAHTAGAGSSTAVSHTHPYSYTDTVNNYIHDSVQSERIYASFNSSTGTLYFYSTAGTIYYNSDKSSNFNKFVSMITTETKKNIVQ